MLHRLGLVLSVLLVSVGACSWEATARHVTSNVSLTCPFVAPGMHLTPTRLGEPMVWSDAGDAFEVLLFDAAGVSVDAVTRTGDHTWAPPTRALATCPLPGVYKATGFSLELTSAGTFSQTVSISTTTCATTGQYTASDQTLTLTVATASSGCGGLITPDMKVSSLIAFSGDCQQVTIQVAGSITSLQRSSSASRLLLSLLVMAITSARIFY
ncbi:hypothetical protein SDRG_16450 [Saprolegnia diclina VS20]|uniref:Secreted protein n=1 Tax=Saprolegnia diclina (strain VS20) TaxID=1156394 RepID=T0R893_SAPDV|nr:hypothetical protein SDRG_16450 [Saprolegnia diclina VS20]EQC25712.1 hypothetical protein SDRG_16450 [Saprolegnia diclina VS20]|eukprot:XP_008620882.1 hypothetical protein SDRG_16450 [Saprolegnia diclina VS20]